MCQHQIVLWPSAPKLNENHGFGTKWCPHQLLLSASLVALAQGPAEKAETWGQDVQNGGLGWWVGMSLKYVNFGVCWAPDLWSWEAFTNSTASYSYGLLNFVVPEGILIGRIPPTRLPGAITIVPGLSSPCSCCSAHTPACLLFLHSFISSCQAWAVAHCNNISS